ncbi:MAG: lipoprotein transmembrane [Glaciimonas sp.]|nr:lipoprotein transmembrane [Glaciimonas sp.]
MGFLTRNKSSLFLACALCSFSSAGFAAESAGVNMDDAVMVGKQQLYLNGLGVRHKMIFKVYVAGLYLTGKKTSVPEVLAAIGPKRVRIVMLRDVSNEEFGRGFLAGIRQNSDRAELMKITGPLMKFGELFASVPELKKGDVLTTDWLPGVGTQMQLNGKNIGDIIPDESFYHALLKIWLGEKPLDNALKHLLLGATATESARTNSR